jgi:hypothetical protein
MLLAAVADVAAMLTADTELRTAVAVDEDGTVATPTGCPIPQAASSVIPVKLETAEAAIPNAARLVTGVGMIFLTGRQTDGHIGRDDERACGTRRPSLACRRILV